VSDVMAAVPGVDEGGELNRHRTVFRMNEAALPLLGRKGLKEHDPAGVESFKQFQRPLDGGGRVVQIGPGGFIVGLDGGIIFREGEADADEGVHVAIGEVMDNLPDGPATFAVRGVEVAVVETLNGVTKFSR